MGTSTRGMLWCIAYVTLAVTPAAVAAFSAEFATRSRSSQIGITAGYVALAMMALEFALISKIHAAADAFGQDALLRFHRWVGILVPWLIGLHVSLMVANGFPAGWINPLADAGWAIRWGACSLWSLVLLVLVSLFRRPLRLAYEWWIWTHGVLAEVAVAAAVAHVLLLDGLAAAGLLRGILAGYALVVGAVRIWFSLVRPLRLWRRPWEVVENRREQGETRTLVLKPVGHPGFTFEPGQFAWLNTGRTPFHKDRHPISMSSAAPDEPGTPVAFSIKALGDWSGTDVPALRHGQRVWVDGPFGVFSADRHQGPGYVLIGGGAGIAPLYSICQTLAQRGDVRPVVLFFGGARLESLTFKAELDGLTERMNLRVIYALEDPPPDWDGARGYLTAELLRAHLPPQWRRFQYFVCGPEPMMDAVEAALRLTGIPASQVHTERFVMV